MLLDNLKLERTLLAWMVTAVLPEFPDPVREYGMAIVS